MSETTTTDRDRRYEGKVVFITGAARGQGRNHAVRFAAGGRPHHRHRHLQGPAEHAPYPLATEEDLAETVRQVESAGGAMHAEVADVRDYRPLREAAKAGIEKFGRLDVILANAGTYAPLPVQFVSTDGWDETVGRQPHGRVPHASRPGSDR